MRHQRISQKESFFRCSRTFLWDQKKTKKNACQMPNSYLCTRGDLKKKIVIYWSWFWKEVVLYQWRQSTRSVGQYCWKDVCWIRRKRMSIFPCYDSFVQRSNKRHRTWKCVDSLCCRPGNDWNYFSQNCFCKPAQSLWSSRGDMWRVWIPSRENGATCCDGAINRAQCD